MNLTTLPLGLSEHDARLAWELTANILPMGEIMKRYDLDFDSLAEKRLDPTFRAVLEEYGRAWSSSLSAQERIRVKAALLVEDGLLDIFRILKSADTAPAAKLDAFTALSKAGDVGTAKKDSAAGGERFSVTINLPGSQAVKIDTRTFDQDAT